MVLYYMYMMLSGQNHIKMYGQLEMSPQKFAKIYFKYI